MNEANRDYLQKYTLDPDRELLLWEKWVRIRKEEIKNLSQRTKRPPIDLVMNQDDTFRNIKEQDDLLEKVRLNSRPGDVFWELPERLRQRCCCDGPYEVIKTKAELRKTKYIEHVRVPNAIKKGEKGMIGTSTRPTLSKLKAGYNEYKEKREEELKDDIVKLQSHKPDTDELVVLGSVPSTGESHELENEFPRPPEIVVEDCSDKVPNPYDEPLESVYALRINDRIFKMDRVTVTNKSHSLVKLKIKSDNSILHETPKNYYTWAYYFKVPLKSLGRAKFVLENLGTVSIRYVFQKSLEEPNLNYKALPINNMRYEQKFFFCKNEDLIAPGQTKEIVISYISEKLGIHEESWELKILNDSFFKVLKEKIVLNLIGETIEDILTMNNRIEELKVKIDHKSDSLMVLNLLNTAFDNAFTTKPETYPYKKYFLECDLFVTKNPDYYFHPTKVQELKDIFTEMTGEEWDMSIVTWRKAMVEKEFNERMVYYEILKQANRDLLKPCLDDIDDLSRQKYRMVKLLLNKYIDTFYDERTRLSGAYGLIDENTTRASELDFESSIITSPVEYRKKISLNQIDNSQNTTIDTGSTIYSHRNEVFEVFYLHMYDHLSHTMEICAGVLCSLDLNRKINYNLCPKLN